MRARGNKEKARSGARPESKYVADFSNSRISEDTFFAKYCMYLSGARKRHMSKRKTSKKLIRRL